jgi:hypothetical protein
MERSGLCNKSCADIFSWQIRYYARKETLLTQAAEVAAKAFGTGGMATPGAIRTITGKEVSMREKL